MGRTTHGFTLIELMLVVAIIGLLAAIAVPKFGNLIIKAKEAGVKAQLGALRSAFSIYQADNEGYYPMATLFVDRILVPKYIEQIPSISIPTVSESIHPKGSRFLPADAPQDINWFPNAGRPWFTQIWTTPQGHSYMTGFIGVNCTHPDSNGRIWSTW